MRYRNGRQLYQPTVSLEGRKRTLVLRHIPLRELRFTARDWCKFPAEHSPVLDGKRLKDLAGNAGLRTMGIEPSACFSAWRRKAILWEYHVAHGMRNELVSFERRGE